MHHIIIRGIERKVIFKDSQDYSSFLNRLRNVLTETKTPCFAWTFMTNHAHILLRTGYVSYFHLNPLRAGIVKDLKALKTYPHSGHGVIMGKLKNDWQHVDYILNMFGRKVGYTRRSYAAFVAKGAY